MFQSRYRAASHFRSSSSGVSKLPPSSSFNLVIERLLISGQRCQRRCQGCQVSISLSSGFSFQVIALGYIRQMTRKFQSRYRAASHFRPSESGQCSTRRSVSISLSSGFSFQDFATASRRSAAVGFQSRYRAASHFRRHRKRRRGCLLRGFNLVIERLLISGYTIFDRQCQIYFDLFQSRYRAASHFRSVPAEPLIRFGRTPALLPACIFSATMHANYQCKNSVQPRHIRFNPPSARETGISDPFPWQIFPGWY